MQIERYRFIRDQAAWEEYKNKAEVSWELQVTSTPSSYPCAVAAYPDTAAGRVVCCFMYQETAQRFLNLANVQEPVANRVPTINEEYFKFVNAHLLCLVRAVTLANLVNEKDYLKLFTKLVAELDGEDAMDAAGVSGDALLKRARDLKDGDVA